MFKAISAVMAVFPIAGILLFLAAVIGYLMNLVKFIGLLFNPELNVEFVLRIVGILTGIIGAIYGYF